jgi:hypothetical protein
MALPTYVAAGAGHSDAGSGSNTPPLPAGIQVNDILLWAIETQNENTPTIANAAGGTWEEVPSSPQGHNGSGSAQSSQLKVFWSRYNGTQTAPSSSGVSDHSVGVITAYRGCKSSGSPFNTSNGDKVNGAGSLSPISIPGATTTVADCLIVNLVATNLDNATGAGLGAWTNSDLANITERTETGTTNGTGGTLGVMTGEKASAGTYGSTSATLSASCRTAGYITLALEPAGAAVASDNLLLLGA